ncbi:MAG: hypothetical protein JXO22_03710 [Phycisphaerae bacterium]|nr:hypothetical protein [Phycisphaerae bacterium]
MRKLLAFALVLACSATVAHGVVAYAPNALPRPFPFDGPDELIRFDTDDPANFEIVGSMGVNDIGFGGMDFDADGNLWAYASLYKSTGGAASGLYSVDTATGQATLVGNSYQSLDDLAYNPVDGKMYGIRSQGADMRLYSINVATGATTHVGNFTGMPATPRAIGLAIDSDGNFYIHDNNVDKIYKSNGMAMSELYLLPQDTGYSQGMTIDWSRDDMGYHAAVGQGVFPDYFSQINTFTTDGSSYVLGPDFGPNEYFSGSAYGYPPVEPGDIAIVPLPEPSSLLLLSILALLRRR